MKSIFEDVSVGELIDKIEERNDSVGHEDCWADSSFSFDAELITKFALDPDSMSESEKSKISSYLENYPELREHIKALRDSKEYYIGRSVTFSDI